MSQADLIEPEMTVAAQAAEATADQHRRERGRRLRMSIVSALLTKPLAVVVPFVTLPLFLNYLGEERYGVYATVGAVAMWLGLTNAGLGLGLINRLADCYVSGDQQLARRYVSSLIVVSLAIMLAATVVLAAVTPFVNWHVLFPAEGARAVRETPWAVFAAGAVTFFGIFVALPASIYAAYQELHRNNWWDAAARVASLAACVAVVYTPWGLVGVILAASGVPALVRFVNLLYQLTVEKPWLRPSPRLFEFALVKRVMGEGICFFVLQMAVIALFQTDKIIISAMINPAEVTAYDAVGRLFLAGYGLFMMFLMPLWSAHGESLRRGDLAWVRKSLRNSLLLGCGLLLVLGVVLTLFGRPIVRFWTRQDIEFSRSLVVALTGLFVLRVWVDCRSTILNSAGILGPQMVFFGAHAAANLVLAVVLARWYGVEGVAWATVITSLLTSAWGYPWMMRRYVWRNPGRFLTPPAQPPPSSSPPPHDGAGDRIEKVAAP